MPQTSRKQRRNNGRRHARRRGEPAWVCMADEELLEVRLRDLGLTLEGSIVAGRVQELRSELERAGLRFRPYVWLSTDWFTPDGLPGFAIPFFLAHPRLARLERRHMYEVEGGDRESCLRLLRHEAGHAISNAYGLTRRKRWRELFGRASEPYPASYSARPRSRAYVLNLKNWYAQSHPLEDFAETFAVWLRPGSRWRKQYAGWPALEKLEYVDELMGELADQPSRARGRERPESLVKLSMTLGEYYRRKLARYGDEFDVVADRDMLRLFSDQSSSRRRISAASFLRRHRTELRRRVSRVTGLQRYVVDQVLEEMIDTCLVSNLRLARSERETRQDAAILLATRIMETLRGDYPHYSR